MCIQCSATISFSSPTPHICGTDYQIKNEKHLKDCEISGLISCSSGFHFSYEHFKLFKLNNIRTINLKDTIMMKENTIPLALHTITHVFQEVS